MIDSELLTPDAIAEVERFRRVLDLGEGFVFHVIVAGARDEFEAAIARLDRDLVVLRPRPLRDRSPDEAATEILTELDRALDAHPDRPILLDALIAHPEFTWALVFRRLNERRDGMMARHPAPFILAVSLAGETMLGQEAPDLWSRSGSGMRFATRPSQPAANADPGVPAPPTDPEAFESLCLELWREIWGDPGAQQHGRQGQRQTGVDLLGRTRLGLVGVRCVLVDGRKGRPLSLRKLEEAVAAARNFRPGLRRFILATTGPRDVTLQARARELSRSGQIEIEIWFWDDIWRGLYERRRRSRAGHALSNAGQLAMAAPAAEEPCTRTWRERRAPHAGVLAERQLVAGNLPVAKDLAEQAMAAASRDGDPSLWVATRTLLATIEHQMGRLESALQNFMAAEAIQAESQPRSPLLSSLPGFRYCELLLARAERSASRGDRNEAEAAACRMVERRAETALEWAELATGPLLDIGLARLTLARARLVRVILEGSPSSSVSADVEAALASLRRAGDFTFLPPGLVTRAWYRSLQADLSGAEADVAEAKEVAVRCQMLLHLTDVYCSRARFFHDHVALAEARRLVEKLGYGRRLAELEDLESAAASW